MTFATKNIGRARFGIAMIILALYGSALFVRDALMADRKVKLKDQLGRVVRLDDGNAGARPPR